MSSGRHVPSSLVRLKNFLFLMLRNRMALFGLILLALFSGTALGAPLLTPYDPQGSVVSASFNEPEWITFFEGEVGYSRNRDFTNIATPTTSVPVSSSLVGPDSMDVRITSNPTGGIVVVQKTMEWDFRGAAERFVGRVKVTAPSAVASFPPSNVTLFIDRLTSAGEQEERWKLWEQSLIPGDNSPPYPLDSLSNPLNVRLGTPGNTAAKVLIPQAVSPRPYAFGVQIALPPGLSGVSFSVADLELHVYGNTWGYLGTDDGGHDIFSQLVYGARLSLYVGLVATLIGVGLGLLVGLIAGYLGKIVDETLMRFTDMMLVVPGLPLLIVLASVIGSSLTNIIIILGFLGWMGFARLVRSQVLSLRERPFIEAAKASGAGTGYTLLKHIFPNVVSLTYVNLALSVPAAIVGEAALSFLGLADTNVVTWGRMLALARQVGGTAGNLYWWWVIPPGIAIAAISLSFILIGYSLDEIFNPKLRKRR